MPVIELLLGFITSNANLLSIGDNDEITYIQMAAEYRLMLAHKQARYLSSQLA